MEYLDFLDKKRVRHTNAGFTVDVNSLNNKLFEWQRYIVRWALIKGRAALFEDTGLGKTCQQLVWADQVANHTGKPVIIYAPLSVTHQTKREAEKFGIESVRIVRGDSDVKPGINIANYEIMEHFNPALFSGVVLDESSILKSFTSKTRKFLIGNYRNVPFKLACTATPAPNDYEELGNHSEFLGVMRRYEMLSMFFVHNMKNIRIWRLKGHAESAFWEWITLWACVIKTPADLGYSDAGYVLPELKVHECVTEIKNMDTGSKLFLVAEDVKTLTERRNARRASQRERVRLASEIANSSNEQVLLWCNLNSEGAELAKLVKNSVEVKGADSNEHKIKTIIDFTNEKIKAVISKPRIYGFGINLQNCHRVIFVGLSDSFEQYYQAVRRCYRFGQKYPVEVYIVISDIEESVRDNIERKRKESEKMIGELVKHTKDILKADIFDKARVVMNYIPVEDIQIPGWIRSENEGY